MSDSIDSPPQIARRAEYSLISAAVFFYVLGIVHPFFVDSPHALPEKFLFNVCLGLAIVFQTEVLVRWQQAGKPGFEEPRHGVVFMLTAFGGAGLLYGAWVLPDYFFGAIIVLATGFVTLVYTRGFSTNALAASLDLAYRAAQLQAREHALRAIIAGAGVFILLSAAELANPPLWLPLALLMWLGAVVATGWMWWHRRWELRP
jgi:hypothetical protein